jgi:hypothetical protein
MIDPWGLVIVLALGCAYLIWYGLRMGWRVHQEQMEVALQRDYARQWRENYDIAERRLAAFERAISVTISAEDRVSPVMDRLRTRINDTVRQIEASVYGHGEEPKPLLAIRHPEDFAAEFKEGHVAPDGSIWSTPAIRYTQGLVRVAVGEREKAEMFGWEWAGWDGKDQCNLMRHA